MRSVHHLSAFLVAVLGACATSPADPEGRPKHTAESDSDAASTDDSGGGDSAIPDSGAGDTADVDSGAGDSGGGDTGETAPQGTGGTGGPLGTGSGTIGDSTYSWYAPACIATAHPVAVVYTMHGSGGRGDQMVALWQPVADAHCILVVGLDSQSQNSWNFNGDISNFADLLGQIEGEYDVGWEYLHGYSAGAHWTYIVGTVNSAYFSGIGVYAGSLSYAEQWGYWPRKAGPPRPVAIAHGTADTTVPYTEATHAYDEFTAAGWPADLYTIEGATHAYETSCEERAWSFWVSER